MNTAATDRRSSAPCNHATVSAASSVPARARRRTLARVAAAGALLAALAGLATGCQSLGMQTPAGFARVTREDPSYRYRAVSAYGVVLGVRVVANEAQGNLDFWAEAIDHQLRRDGSYRPEGSETVRTSAGATGRQLRYTQGDPNNSSTYWVTLFVAGSQVYVVEAGGATTAFNRAQGSIESAIRSFSGG